LKPEIVPEKKCEKKEPCVEEKKVVVIPKPPV
jgi:hypothetical protein